MHTPTFETEEMNRIATRMREVANSPKARQLDTAMYADAKAAFWKKYFPTFAAMELVVLAGNWHFGGDALLSWMCAAVPLLGAALFYPRK